MKKIEAEVYWDGKTVEVINLSFVLEQLRENFQPGYLEISIRAMWQWKSNQHMAHFFAAVAGAFHEFLSDSGYNFPNKLDSLKYIMENLPSESGFGLSDKWCDVGYGPNGNVVKRSAKSISAMGRADLCDLEADLTKLAGDMGIDIVDSETFKKSAK
jgi:hypothetical protein